MSTRYLGATFNKISSMRKRFEQQLTIGQLPIEAVCINPKSKNALDELLVALKAIYCNKEYNEKIFSVLEKYINSGKKNTGRKNSPNSHGRQRFRKGSAMRAGTRNPM